jgi:hypothetical protein
MDPNETLATLRTEAGDIITCIATDPEGSDGRIIAAAADMAEAFEALDEWLSKGGFLPDAWAPKSPAYGENPKLDQLFHDTFVTALEGGIGYWAASTTYHWAIDNDLMGEDLEGFYSDIQDANGDGDDADFEPVRIDRAVIARGFDRLLAGAEPRLNAALRQQITAGYHNPDDADFDAEHADVIVQVGLFGTVIYA